MTARSQNDRLTRASVKEAIGKITGDDAVAAAGARQAAMVEREPRPDHLHTRRPGTATPAE